MVTPATLALIGATSSMSPDAQRRALRADAAIALGSTVATIGVLILHARGRTQEAFGLAMIASAISGVAAAARLFAAAEAIRDDA